MEKNSRTAISSSSKKAFKPPVPLAEDDSQFFSWSFDKIDYSPDHDWCIECLDTKEFIENILKSLKSFETMTWAGVKSSSGGKSVGNGTNNHSIPWQDLVKKGRELFIKYKYAESFETVFSLRLTSKIRLYGVRIGKILHIIWYDPYHGTDKGLCLTGSSRKRQIKNR